MPMSLLFLDLIPCRSVRIVGIGIATSIHRGNRSDGAHSRRNSTSDAIAEMVSHMWRCYTFYDSMWKESREYIYVNVLCANQIAKLSSISGIIIRKVRRGVCTRESEQSAWKVTREIATTISPACKDTDATEVTNTIFNRSLRHAHSYDVGFPFLL